MIKENKNLITNGLYSKLGFEDFKTSYDIRIFGKHIPLLKEMSKHFIVFEPKINEIGFLYLDKEERDFIIKNKDILINSPLAFTSKNAFCMLTKISMQDVVIMDFFEVSHISINKNLTTVGSSWFSLYFVDNYNIRQKHKSKSVSYELNLKNFNKLLKGNFSIFAIFYLNYLSKTSPFIKDLSKDYKKNVDSINIPVNFSMLENIKNKKQLLEIKTKEKFPNSTNKFPLNYSYSLFKSKKHLNINYISKITSIDRLKNFNFVGNEKDRVSDFVKKYYCYILNINEEDEDDYENTTVSDYIHMSIKLKKQFNLRLNSFKRLEELHDELCTEYNLKQIKNTKMIIKKDNPFLQLKLPKKFKLIDDKEKLITEGVENRNCVLSYLDWINKEKCIIYTTNYEGKKYTIEFVIKRNKFYLAQIRGFGNSYAPNELIDYINEYIKDQKVISTKKKKIII